jgi:hypothetical protein
MRGCVLSSLIPASLLCHSSAVNLTKAMLRADCLSSTCIFMLSTPSCSACQPCCACQLLSSQAARHLDHS